MLRRILPPVGVLAILAPLYLFVVDPFPMPEQIWGISRDLWLLTAFAAIFLWVTAFSFTASPAATPSPRASAQAPAPAKEPSKSKPVALPPSPPAKILSEAAWSADTDQVGHSKGGPAPGGALAQPNSAPHPAVVVSPFEGSPSPVAVGASGLASSPFDSPGMTMMMPSVIPSPAATVAPPSTGAFAAPTVAAPPTISAPSAASPIESFASGVPSSDVLPAPSRALPSMEQDEGGKTLLGLKLENLNSGGSSQPSPSAATPLATENSFETLYRDFVRIRAENGEPPAPSREKFIDSLNARRDSIRRDTGVDDVRFEVYSKAGRATLRATPIRRSH